MKMGAVSAVDAAFLIAVLVRAGCEFLCIEVALAGAVLGEVVDHCELDDGGEDECKRQKYEKVQRRWVRNFR